MKIAVVGCSFAGLSFSYFLSKMSNNIDLTLFDKKSEIGASRTSTCFTTLKVLKDLHVESSILKEFDNLTLHYRDNEHKIKTPIYATFDYKKLCTLLSKEINGEIKLRNNVNVENMKKGYDFLIDASGWSSRIDRNKRLTFGLEREVKINSLNSDTFHIFVGRHIIEGGYGWAFPVSKNKFRVGIGSYKTLNFLKKLDEFLAVNFNCKEKSKPIGGFIAYGLSRNIVKDNIICLGDSASQTFPLTYEGIRPAVLFSKALAKLIYSHSQGKISFGELVNSYLNQSKRSFLYYILLKAQNIALNVNDWTYNLLMRYPLKSQKIVSLYSKKYFF